MKATITTRLYCTFEKAVDYVNRSAMLEYVSYPILVFKPINKGTYPKVWKEGRHQVRLYLFGFIPFGKQYIGIEEIKTNDPKEYII
jgi:hypothetical protein